MFAGVSRGTMVNLDLSITYLMNDYGNWTNEAEGEFLRLILP